MKVLIPIALTAAALVACSTEPDAEVCIEKKITRNDVTTYGAYHDRYEEWKEKTGCRNLDCDGYFTIEECYDVHYK